MAKIEKLQAGDIMLMPTEGISDIYRFLYSVSKPTAQMFVTGVKMFLKKYTNSPIVLNAVDDLINSDKIVKDALHFIISYTGQKYIHAEVMIGSRYNLAGWTNGSKIVKYPLHVFDKFDIYRIEGIEPEKIKDVAIKHWNVPYDLASLILNGGVELLTGIFRIDENFLEEMLGEYYNNPKAYICSELVARVYKSAGYKFYDNPEYISPQDLIDLPKQEGLKVEKIW